MWWTPSYPSTYFMVFNFSEINSRTVKKQTWKSFICHLAAKCQIVILIYHIETEELYCMRCYIVRYTYTERTQIFEQATSGIHVQKWGCGEGWAPGGHAAISPPSFVGRGKVFTWRWTTPPGCINSPFWKLNNPPPPPQPPLENMWRHC